MAVGSQGRVVCQGEAGREVNRAGLIATLQVSVGTKVKKGDKLLMMEAMKMQNTGYAPCAGVVAELHVALADTVEAKDLLIKIRAAG